MINRWGTAEVTHSDFVPPGGGTERLMEEKSVRGPRIELTGNRSAVIDGCDGIIDYDENRVSVKLGRITAHIAGRSLKLRVLTENTAIIEGYIHSVEYT